MRDCFEPGSTQVFCWSDASRRGCVSSNARVVPSGSADRESSFEDRGNLAKESECVRLLPLKCVAPDDGSAVIIIITVIRSLLATVLCTLIVAIPASATRIRRLSLEEIRDRASAVLVVEVIDSSARLGEAGMVWTDYHVRVDEVLRGARRAGDVVRLSFAGGRAEGRNVGIDGVPQLLVGSHYLFFFDDVPMRPVPAIGWGQGIFRIELDGESERLVSVNREVLDIDGAGAIGRSKHRPRFSDARAPRMLPDPLVFNGDGSIARQERREISASIHAARGRNASLDEVRRFVRGDLAERREIRTER